MTSERGRRVEELYHAALARDERDRAAFLAAMCADDDIVRHEVESLLAQSGATIQDNGAAGIVDSVTGSARFAEGMHGSHLAHYRIENRIGAGGMGVVFRAVDTRLNRTVAVKIVGETRALDDDRRQRFLKEARAAAALTHPNVVTIHAVETAGDIDFIVMELVEGRALAERLASRRSSIVDVLSVGEQIASALETAHAAGIVHRDIKPANIMVSESGRVKVLDFGIAKQLLPTPSPHASTLSAPAMTRAGVVVGTLRYMSPEQVQGRAVDGQSDVFSLGIVLYEMLSGRRPFEGATDVEIVAKILEGQPQPLEALRRDVPVPLARLVEACLEKDRSRRPSALEMHRRLVAMRAAPRVLAMSGRSIAFALVVLSAAAALATGWWWGSGREVREARRRLPEIHRLAAQYDFDGFYRAAREVVPVLADDQQLRQVWLNLTNDPTPIETDPPGAEVSIKGYSAVDATWIALGTSPVASLRTPFGPVRAKVAKDGFAPLEVMLYPFSPKYPLDPIDVVPEGMIRVTANASTLEGTTLSLPDFWMDRFEVTNRQFKAFLDAGGYRTERYWREPFTENGRRLSWADAMKRFVDTTGRAGPATWELGAYPPGQDAFPVSGVSWYEAAAYAEFAGKSLPTAFQWRGAGGFEGPYTGLWGDILLLSNFGRRGPAAVGTYQGLGLYGTYDMAGNVKEWCWNAAGNGRLILGGAWNEPTYMYNDQDIQAPLSRRPEYGFRLVKNIATQPPASYERVQKLTRDYATEEPINDAAFVIVQSLYRYDPRPLDAKIEDRQNAPNWRRETVTIDVPYGRDERLTLYVYLPKSSAPPYQPVVFFPGGDAEVLRSSRDLRLTEADFLIRGGRALLYPVYQGTYERQVPRTGTNALRDVTIARVKDVGRVLDYIESRTDLDTERIGYFGLSMGAVNGVIAVALDPRFKAAVFASGGMPQRALPPEIDLVNFAPRIVAPTLMINGIDDFIRPLATAQLPLFRFLGPPSERKRHAQLEGGHIPAHMNEMMREVLDWFDRHLGAATPAS